MANLDFSGLNFDLGDYEEDPLAKFMNPAAAPMAAAPQPFEAPLAAPFASNPNRVAKLNEIDQAMNELRQVQAGQVKDASSREGMTANQLLVTAIAGILPMVMGRMAAGNAGGALGGQAGANIAQGTFANWEKGGADRRAESLAESKLTAEQIKDLVNRRADLEKQGFAAEDSRQTALESAARSDANMDRREDFQIAQQGRSQAFQDSQNDAKQGEINDRTDKNIDLRQNQILGAEADRLARRFQGNPLVKSAYTSIASANNLQNAIDHPNSVTAGQAGTQLATLAGEVGMKTENDIQRNLGATLYRKYVTLKNYATNGASSTLPPEQAAAISELLGVMRPLAEKKIDAVRKEIRGSGLAPYTEQLGKLDDIIMSLGSSADAVNTPGSSGKGYSEDEIQRKMEEIRLREAAGG